MRYVVDRIEEEFAVLEDENCEMTNVKLCELGIEVSEGDVLQFDGSEYFIDVEAKQEIEERISDLVDELFV